MRTFPLCRLPAVAALGLLALLGGCASAPYDTAYYDAYTYGQMHSYSTEYGHPYAGYPYYGRPYYGRPYYYGYPDGGYIWREPRWQDPPPPRPPQNVPPPAPRPPRIISMPQPEGGMPSLTPRTPTLGNGVEMP